MNRSGTQARGLPERLLVLLTGANRPLSLRDAARGVRAYDSSARYALRRLVERALIRETAKAYSLAVGGDVLDFELSCATRVLGAAESLRLLTALNDSIAFIALRSDSRPALAVLSESIDAGAVLRLRELVTRHLGLKLEEHEYGDLLGRTVGDEVILKRVRTQLEKGELVKGSLGRLPVPGVRGRFTTAKPLRRTHPDLPHLSRRTLQRIARRYGLRTMGLFGSAVREDFRPDSDVDVLVRYQPGTRHTLASTRELRDELTALLGHRVDVVDERVLHPELQRNIARDLVRLYGRSRSSALAAGAGEAARRASDRRSQTPR